MSEVAEERVEAEARMAAGWLSACWAGVRIDRGVTGGFLRWENVGNADCGRGVAASMLQGPADTTRLRVRI